MKKLLIALLLAATALATSAQTIRIKGSNTFGEELAPRLIAEYGKLHPDVLLDLEAKGSGSGILALFDRTCDIAASSRTMTEDEMRMARSRGIVLRNHTIGYYGVAVVVHPAHPVKNLTHAQVRDIFTGVVRNWKEVGGPDLAIQVHIRDPISGTYLGFQELAMERKPYLAEAAPHTSYHDLARAVTAQPGAIGYVGMTLAAHNGVKALTINGVAPTAANVADQLYPYARQMRFYTDKKLSPATKEFIAYVRSVPGQLLLEDLGFVRRGGLRLPTNSDTQ
jgi:phosphate transport system substrate-binding protein